MQLISILLTGLLGATAALVPEHAPPPPPPPPVQHLEARADANASAGCGKAPPVKPGDWMFGRTRGDREYRVWLPGGYDASRPAPLVLSYHGASGNMGSRVRQDRLSDPRFNTDHLVAYLQGARRDPSDPSSTTWQGAPGAPADDLAYTADVLDAAEAALCVDRARVYATGHSQGGGFVGRLACDDPGLARRLAAVAPVSGAFYNTAVDKEADCEPRSLRDACAVADAAGARPWRDGRGLPVLELHGGADDTISFHGGFRKGACLPAIRHWAKDWARRDRLDLKDAVVPIPGTRNGVKYVYGDGLVTLVYAGDDVGHVWMSEDRGNAGIEASAMVMEFFRKYSL